MKAKPGSYDWANLKTVDPAQLTAPPIMKWAVENVLPAKGLAVLTGQPGVGKSAVALDLCSCVMSGAQWAGQFAVDKPRNVVYFALERLDAQWRRIAGLIAAGRIDASIAKDRFRVAGEIPHEVIQFESPWSLFSPGVQSHMQESLIVVDTLSKILGFTDINDWSPMSKLMTSLQKFSVQANACVLLIHHEPKNSHFAATGSAGSNAIFAALDSEVRLVRKGAAVPGTLSLSKLSEGKAIEPLRYDISSQALAVGDTEFTVPIVDWQGAVAASTEDSELEVISNILRIIQATDIESAETTGVFKQLLDAQSPIRSVLDELALDNPDGCKAVLDHAADRQWLGRRMRAMVEEGQVSSVMDGAKTKYYVPKEATEVAT